MTVPDRSLGLIFHNEFQKKNPKEIIMIDKATNDEVTYQMLVETTTKLAIYLTKLGVKQDDVIAIMAPNSWKIVATVIAAFYIGAPVNMLNKDYKENELKHLLGITKPVLIFCTQESVSSILKLKIKIFSPRIIIFDSNPLSDFENFDNIIKITSYSEAFKPVDLNPKESTSLLIASSGTTGLPKCVQISHDNFRVALIAGGDSKLFNFNHTETVFAYLPFYHLLGYGIILNCIYHGSKAIIFEKFVANNFLDDIQNFKVTLLFAVPSILLFLAKSELVGKYDFSSVRDIIYGGAPSKTIDKLVQTRMKLQSIRQGYAMTESTTVVALMPKKNHVDDSVGQITSHFQVIICNSDTGRKLPINQTGEILFKGEGVTKGYLGDEEATRNAFDEDGFFKTGDLGYLDGDGFLYIVGRLKEIIKYKSFQVSPTELENLLIQHPGVKDVGVIGLPDERAGELPLAFVVKTPNMDVTEKEIKSFVADNVAAYKQLHGGVRFVNEIPRNSTGKILRNELRDLLATNLTTS